ncbi:5-oxoprolinase [Eumeta japonica]|uniref:5-oxoprolinase n=1 Tax=Eumeta variegata TaxID=151549 RepID=A0A4C1YYU8_EUMVA|nr:5-oxoprolinase [Eumeta japonica]
MNTVGFQFAIDRGGTFTDVFARCPTGKIRVMKLLSVDPSNYDDAPREAIKRILQEELKARMRRRGSPPVYPLGQRSERRIKEVCFGVYPPDMSKLLKEREEFWADVKDIVKYGKNERIVIIAGKAVGYLITGAKLSLYPSTKGKAYGRMDELSLKCLLYADDHVILAPLCQIQEMITNMNDSFEKRACVESWKDRCRNSDIRAQCCLKKEVVTRVERDMWRCFVHLEKINGSRLTKRIYKANETGNALDENGKVKASLIHSIRMGTTVATNALLERKGEKMALVINKGFKDLLYIGNQARPNIFQLDIRRPGVLYSSVIEVDCRVVPALEDQCQIEKSSKNWKEVVGSTGEKMLITKELNEEEVEIKLIELKKSGIESIAVVLAHSYTYHDHELRIGKIAKELGFTQISLSHEVMSMVRMVARGFTACADAYLTPHIRRYVKGFVTGFSSDLDDRNVLFMQSDGGLTPMDKFNGSRAILSGPAGGVVGYAMTSYGSETNLPVIGFDMGGTSTDVSRYAGSLEHVHEATTAGVTIQAPQLDINTVAAGGGSMLFFRSGMFVVGPESAGAHPGPCCYRKGGPLTVTDTNLVLGRLLPEYFPKIFGASEKEPLDKEASLRNFEKLTTDINRALTTARGHDASHHALACFGGAGGQHACAVARSLGISTVLIHKYAGILSAYGMALADVVHEAQEPCAKRYKPESFDYLDNALEKLGGTCKEKLRAQVDHHYLKNGFTDSQIVLEPYLHLRYEGTDCALMISPASQAVEDTSCKHGDFYTAFIDRYKNEFGFTISGRDIIVDDIRVRGVGKSEVAEQVAPPSGKGVIPKPVKVAHVYYETGYQETNVYLLEELAPDQEICGPAIIMDNLSTILVEPDCKALITKYGDIRITIGSGKPKKITTDLDSIQLSIFSHRFMSIAEQMGRILQRTSISVNIKERLDFSCALFGPDGGLVSNAPHIPVHLGAMQETVQYQMNVRGDSMKPGEVYLANHPKAGGSHLPDLTVITPVFHKSQKPIFFVASRGHHADIGGLTPGSMPPASTSLAQEGATFKSFLLVGDNKFRERELIEELMKPGQVEGCSGTRNLADNLSDLKAQVAANQRASIFYGIQLVGELIDQYGLDVVQAYMAHIQKNAEVAVRDMLKLLLSDNSDEENSSESEKEDHIEVDPAYESVSEDEVSSLTQYPPPGLDVQVNDHASPSIEDHIPGTSAQERDELIIIPSRNILAEKISTNGHP